MDLLLRCLGCKCSLIITGGFFLSVASIRLDELHQQPARKMPAGIRHYNFGVEIEAVTKPYGNCESFSNVDWYRQLAQKLRNRGIQAVHDDCSKYSKHPEYYGGKWFVTRDGSLKRPRPYGS